MASNNFAVLKNRICGGGFYSCREVVDWLATAMLKKCLCNIREKIFSPQIS
jgi:hypothetical protein